MSKQRKELNSIAVLSIRLQDLKNDLSLLEAAQYVSDRTMNELLVDEDYKLEANLEYAIDEIYKEIGKIEKELIRLNNKL